MFMGADRSGDRLRARACARRIGANRRRACAEGHLSEADLEMAFALIEARRDHFRRSAVQLTLSGVPASPYGDRPPLPRSRFPVPHYQPARRVIRSG